MDYMEKLLEEDIFKTSQVLDDPGWGAPPKISGWKNTLGVPFFLILDKKHKQWQLLCVWLGFPHSFCSSGGLLIYQEKSIEMSMGR